HVSLAVRIRGILTACSQPGKHTGYEHDVWLKSKQQAARSWQQPVPNLRATFKRRKKYMQFRRLIQRALLLTGLPFSMSAQFSTDCETMLKPVFDWASSDTSHHVFATVTKHFATQSDDAFMDPVHYSNDEVTRFVNKATIPPIQGFQGLLPLK